MVGLQVQFGYFDLPVLVRCNWPPEGGWPACSPDAPEGPESYFVHRHWSDFWELLGEVMMAIVGNIEPMAGEVPKDPTTVLVAD